MSTYEYSLSEDNPFRGKEDPVSRAAAAYWEARNAAEELTEIENEGGREIADADLIFGGLARTLSNVEEAAKQLNPEERDMARMLVDLEIGPQEFNAPELDLSDHTEGEFKLIEDEDSKEESK